MTRRVYLDWLRGIAVLCMIEWHVLDAWTIGEGRDTPAWDVIRTIGGVAAPLFLFLAGLAVPLAGDARVRRGVPVADAAWSLQKRGWQIFLLAHVFRFQSFLLNPNARWHAILKPDILNVLGLGLVAAAFLWGRSRRGRRAAVWFVVPAAITLALTPFAPLWQWPSVLHPRLEAYIRPVGGYGVFTLFPTIAFVFAGAWIGSILSAPRSDTDDGRTHRLLLWLGLIAIGLGTLAGWSPPTLARTNFFLTPLALFVWRTGTMLVMLWAAWAWIRRRPAGPSHPIVLFGRTSLFVYWIHVELAYGVLSYPLHRALPLPWSLAGLVAVTTAMFLLARWWDRLPAAPLIPAHMRPARAAGPSLKP